MKFAHATAAVILAVPLALDGAAIPDDPPADLPKAPEGWRYVTGKDGSYRFLFPAQTRRSGTRESSSSRRGLTIKSQINYCELADGTAYLVSAEKMSGPALRGMKISETYAAILDGIKEKGYEVSEPKEFMIGTAKGREYLLTKEKEVQRKVLLILRDARVFDITVAGTKEQVTSPEADTFLKSLTILPKMPPKNPGGN